MEWTYHSTTEHCQNQEMYRETIEIRFGPPQKIEVVHQKSSECLTLGQGFFTFLTKKPQPVLELFHTLTVNLNNNVFKPQ